MLLYRKDEIVEKAAESNQLSWSERTPVQFVHDYYNEDWHIKAGTLAYIKVGTVVTTIEAFDGKESVECRIIADLAAGKDTIEIPAIAFDDGTLLVRDEKRELLPYDEVFALPPDIAFHAMQEYEKVETKILKDANACDTKITIISVALALTGIILIGMVFLICMPRINEGADTSVLTVPLFLTLIGLCCFFTGIMLKIFYGLYDCPAIENRRLRKQKMVLEDELLRIDTENVKAHEKGGAK